MARSASDAAAVPEVRKRVPWLDRFLPQQLDDEERSRRHARLVVRLAFGAALLDGFFAVFFVTVLDAWRPALVLAGATVASACVPWVLRRTSTAFAGNVLAAVAFLALGLTSYVRGGLVFPVFAWNLSIPLAAAIMGRSRTTVVWSLLIAVQGTLLLTFGEPVPPTQYSILSVFGLLGVIVTAGLVLDNRERQMVDQQVALREELLNQQRLESIGLLAAGVAHDLNNVLSIIRTHASLGIEESQDQSVREDFDAIVDATDRGAKLTGSLLGLGKGDSSASSSDVAERIEALSKIFEVVLQSGVEIDFEIEDGLPPVSMRSHHLEHVLVNLVVNAGEAMPEGGRIRVATSNLVVSDPETVEVDVRAGEYVIVSVSDTGDGIPEDALQAVFEPHYTTKDNGTGIGLASVRATLSSCGGGIHATSKVGEGTEFRVFLPVKGNTGMRRISGSIRQWRTSGTRRRAPSDPGKAPASHRRGRSVS